MDRAAFHFLRDRHSHQRALMLGALGGITTIILISKETSYQLLGGAIFVAYKIVHLVFRAQLLARLKQEIIGSLQQHQTELQQLDSTHQDRLRPLLYADKTRHLKIINDEIMKCVKVHHLTFQQIELFLRQNNCFTHLIARKRNFTHSDNLRFLLPHDPAEKTYLLFTSTRDQAEALTELVEESVTYQENLDKLNDTGFMTMMDNVPLEAHFHGGMLLFPSGQALDLGQD